MLRSGPKYVAVGYPPISHAPLHSGKNGRKIDGEGGKGEEMQLSPAGVMLRSMILPAMLCDTRHWARVVAGRPARKKIKNVKDE